MKNSVATVALLAALVLCSALCLSNQPKVFVDNENVKISSQGSIMIVSDRLNGQEYVFRRKNVSRSEAIAEPITAIQTPTIQIEIIPNGGLMVTSGSKVYRITPKWGRCGHGEKSH